MNGAVGQYTALTFAQCINQAFNSYGSGDASRVPVATVVLRLGTYSVEKAERNVFLQINDINGLHQFDVVCTKLVCFIARLTNVDNELFDVNVLLFQTLRDE